MSEFIYLYRTSEADREFEKTRDLYTRAIAADGRLAEAWGGRGLVNMALGRKQDAKVDLERAIQLDAKLESAYRPLLKTLGDNPK